jgi:hypothetical protein
MESGDESSAFETLMLFSAATKSKRSATNTAANATFEFTVHVHLSIPDYALKNIGKRRLYLFSNELG